VRAGRLRPELDRLGAASFLVTNPVDVRYLTGFESSNAAVLVGVDRVLLATDGRYLEAAAAVDGVEVVPAERELLADLGNRLGELVEAPVGFQSDHVTVAGLEALSRNGTELVPAAGVVLSFRAVKDEEELEAIRRAARVTNDAFERLATERLVGRTEAEVAWWLERALREEGAEAMAFDVTVASGPNAALPHHHPGPREIGPRETVIVDAGAKVGGYCADCTRTFATGVLPGGLRRAYPVCRSAQEHGLAAVQAGVATRDADAVARHEIEESGLAPVLHGLGHGVGLEVHEQPRLSDTSEQTLEAGNVVTVEPGVYLAGRGGVRVEDLVIVTQDRAEVLTTVTKELLTLE
jgi:Xaa-Pro aminopeptidase